VAQRQNGERVGLAAAAPAAEENIDLLWHQQHSLLKVIQLKRCHSCAKD
jgi:hypothetical protein